MKNIILSAAFGVLLSSSVCFAYDISAPNYQTDPGCTGDNDQHLMVSSNNGQPCNWPRYVAPKAEPAPVQSAPAPTTPSPIIQGTIKPVTPTVKAPAKAPIEVEAPFVTQPTPEVIVTPPVDFQPQIDSIKLDIFELKRNFLGGIMLITLMSILSVIISFIKNK